MTHANWTLLIKTKYIIIIIIIIIITIFLPWYWIPGDLEITG